MNQKIYEKLVKEFNDQTEKLHQEGKVINLVEYKYLSNCLDCMEYMDENFKIDLDCSAVSLEVLDILFENAYEALQEGSLENVDRFIDMMSGYIGMVYKNEWGGDYVYDEQSEALNVSSNHLYPKKDVEECIYHHKKISELFQMIGEYLS